MMLLSTNIGHNIPANTADINNSTSEDAETKYRS